MQSDIVSNNTRGILTAGGLMQATITEDQSVNSSPSPSPLPTKAIKVVQKNVTTDSITRGLPDTEPTVKVIDQLHQLNVQQGLTNYPLIRKGNQIYAQKLNNENINLKQTPYNNNRSVMEKRSPDFPTRTK